MHSVEPQNYLMEFYVSHFIEFEVNAKLPTFSHKQFQTELVVSYFGFFTLPVKSLSTYHE